MSPELQPGIRFEWQTTVPERGLVPHLFGEHTAFANDMPAVLATGYMVGLMELACTQGIMPYVDWPRAVEGRRVRFKVEAWDGMDKISEGEHERAVIIADKFHLKLAEKKQRAGV